MVNLAVIGAGIGGCSAAYFARKYLPRSKVTVYETEDRVGGRVFTKSEGEMRKELGAVFFNPSNRTICSFVEEMELEVKRNREPTGFVVWNGTEIIFKSSQSMFYEMLRLIARYKLGLLKLRLIIKEAKGKIRTLYSKEGERPMELWELFERTSLDMWYKKPFDQCLLEMGIGRKLIDEIITPVMRIIYSQNANLGGFAGLSSLIGVYGGSTYSLKDGNITLPRRLLKDSGSKVELESKVESIEKTPEGSFRVLVGEKASVFDAVIIATPLEGAGLQLDGVSTTQLRPREYQSVFINVMKGIVDPDFFNLKPNKLLPTILTSPGADPITHISVQKSKSNQPWVTVTSKEPLDTDFLGDIVKNGRSILNHSWSTAYPIFRPIERLPPICIDKGLMYLNSIESAASSLESSAFAALNATLMLRNDLS